VFLVEALPYFIWHSSVLFSSQKMQAKSVSVLLCYWVVFPILTLIHLVMF